MREISVTFLERLSGCAIWGESRQASTVWTRPYSGLRATTTTAVTSLHFSLWTRQGKWTVRCFPKHVILSLPGVHFSVLGSLVSGLFHLSPPGGAPRPHPGFPSLDNAHCEGSCFLLSHCVVDISCLPFSLWACSPADGRRLVHVVCSVPAQWTREWMWWESR